MAKSGKTKKNKRRKNVSHGINFVFCLPNRKRKVSKNKKKGTNIQIKKLEKATQTIRNRKYDIVTHVNFEMTGVNPPKVIKRNAYDFPLCEDLKGIHISIHRPSKSDFKEIFNKSTENQTESMYLKSNSFIINKHCESLSDASSITLQDILDQNSSSITSSPSFSGKIFPENLSMKYEVQDFKDSHIYSFKQKLLEERRNKNNLALSEDSEKLKLDNMKIYDFFETATLVPIGEGVTSLTPTKLDSYSPIVIPPYMAPLLSVKQNESTSTRHSMLRARLASETFDYAKESSNEKNYLNDRNFVENSGIFCKNSNSVECINNEFYTQPQTYSNVVSRTKNHLEKCLSNDIKHFDVSSSQQSKSSSLIFQRQFNSNSPQTTTLNDQEKTDNEHNQMSTAF